MVNMERHTRRRGVAAIAAAGLLGIAWAGTAGVVPSMYSGAIESECQSSTRRPPFRFTSSTRRRSTATRCSYVRPDRYSA